MIVLRENYVLEESLPILITWLYIRLHDRNEYSMCMYDCNEYTKSLLAISFGWLGATGTMQLRISYVKLMT